jgi:protein phosphatase 2C family protein 2/3
MKKKIYSHSLQGRRDDNEDKHEHIINIDGLDTNINSINFFAVFDGHGGRKVSEFLKKNLSKYYTNKINKNMYSKLDIVSKYTNQVFDKLQNKLIKKHPRISQTCGSTACVGVQFKNDLWIFNVGDSRAIKCNKSNIAEQLTLDHKPNNPIEKNRIEQSGGKIEYDGFDWRIKGLSLSRAFGDIDCCPFVNHKPDIFKYEILNDDKFLVFGCDGLFDVMSNQDIIDSIIELYNKKFTGNYAKELAEYAYNKGSSDNITIIIYFI